MFPYTLGCFFGPFLDISIGAVLIWFKFFKKKYKLAELWFGFAISKIYLFLRSNGLIFDFLIIWFLFCFLLFKTFRFLYWSLYLRNFYFLALIRKEAKKKILLILLKIFFLIWLNYMGKKVELLNIKQFLDILHFKTLRRKVVCWIRYQNCIQCSVTLNFGIIILRHMKKDTWDYII